MDQNHEAVPPPSTSHANNLIEQDPSRPSTFKLASPLGGDALILHYPAFSLNPPVDKVAIWLNIIGQCANRFNALRSTFLNHKNEHGAERAVTLKMPNLTKYDPKEDDDPDITGKQHERFYKKFCLIMQIFNTATNTISKMWKGASNPDAKTWYQDRCDVPLLTYICNTTYNSSVKNIRSLNSHYAPFSSEVYGETKYQQMQLIIEQLNFKESDVFLDLGSGVGQLVLYVAGGTKVKKAIGIEKAEVPASYAENMKEEYRLWMNWFKKKYRPYELHYGDFLDPQFKSTIQEATIIFINNFAFNPDLENRIKMEIINELENGRRIVSTKPYAPVNSGKAFNPRSANQLEAILDVEELQTVENPTSWTDRTVPYYLHTVNTAKLQKYYDSKNNSQTGSQSSKNNSRRPSVSSKSNSSNSSREGSQPMIDANLASPPQPMAAPQAPRQVKAAESNKSDFKAEDEDIFGATTRRKWKEQTGELHKAKRKSPTRTPAWNEADREYIPPSMKKAKKEKKEPLQSSVKKEKKEPKTKSATKTARLSTEAAEGLNNMHRMAQEKKPLETEGPGLQRVQLVPSSLTPPPEDRCIFDPRDPLDAYLIETREMYRLYFDRMNETLYRQELLQEITAESMRKNELQRQVDNKQAEFNVELSKGLAAVHDRFVELGMASVQTPTELLANSKRIVADHKDLTQSVASMEIEVAHLSSKTRNAVPYGAALLENITLLDDPTQSWDLSSEKSIHSQYIAKIALENGHTPPKEPEPEQMLVEASVMSPTGPRQRRTKPRNGPGGRKGKQEENSEELDRQVQEFVAVALSVDQQAKERERRTRAAAGPTSEKASKKGAIPGSMVDSVGIPLPRSTIPASLELSTRPEPIPFPIGCRMGTVGDKNPFIINGFPVPYSSALKPFGKIPKKSAKSPDEKEMLPSTSGTPTKQIDQSKICEIDMSLYETPTKPKNPPEPTGRPRPTSNSNRHSSSKERREHKERRKRRHEEAKNPLDQILGEMSREDKRRKKEKVVNEIEPSPPKGEGVFEGGCLTEEWLKTRTPDERMVADFLQRDTILEYLLGRKMAYGRLDGYKIMGFEHKTDQELKEMGTQKFRPGALVTPPPPGEIVQKIEEKPKVLRGPKTPPGSPGKIAKGPKTPPPGPSGIQSNEISSYSEAQMIQQLARMSGMQPETLATFLKSDGWRNLVANQAQIYSQAQDQIQLLTMQQASTSQEQKPPNIDESVKMELVSDCSLSSAGDKHNILAPPPAPPVIPPPPPQAIAVNPAMMMQAQAMAMTTNWTVPPPQLQQRPPPPLNPPPPPAFTTPPPPMPQFTPIIHPPPPQQKPISLLSPHLMHQNPGMRPPPPSGQPSSSFQAASNFPKQYSHIPPPSEPPRPLMSLTPMSPPPPAPPPPPKDEPKIVQKLDESWRTELQNMSWSNQADWSKSEVQWNNETTTQVVDIPVPPPPPTDMVTKNLMTALGLSEGSKPPEPPASLFKNTIPPPPGPMLFNGGPPPRGGRGGHLPPRGHPRHFNNGPPPSHRGNSHSSPHGYLPPAQQLRYQNMGNSPNFVPKKRGGGGRPLKLP